MKMKMKDYHYTFLQKDYLLKKKIVVKDLLEMILILNDVFFPRQTSIRGSRGNIRGHPYGTVPRTTTGSFRIPSSDPYAAILFSQDPLFGIDYDSITPTPFFLTSSPSLEPDQIIPKKSNLSNTKQKRAQQPVIFIEPSITDQPSSTKPIENKNENDPRSLLGKILKIDQNNKSTQEDDHTAFLQTLFFSSLNISINKEQLY